MGWVVEGLTACAADAASAGVRLLYENHVRGTPWTLNDFTQASSRFLEVARRTAPSELGILFDTANNLAMNEPVLDVFDAVAHRIEAVHISDIARAGSFEPTVIGTGVAPVEEVVSRLVEGGFDGWISIEEASRTGPDAFTHAVHYVEQAWERAGGRARGRQR
jgi:sugar phosphate isomerase/epimerase